MSRTGVIVLFLIFSVAQGGERMALHAGVSPSVETRDDGKPLTDAQLLAKLRAVKLTVTWNNKSMADVLKDLSARTGVKIELGAGVEAPAVSLSVAGQSADQALELINKFAGTKTTFADGVVVLK